MDKHNGNGSVATTSSGEKIEVQEKPRPKTLGYKTYPHYWFSHPRDLPPFTFRTVRAMLIDPGIRLNLATRAAPLFAARFGYKDGDKFVEGVEAKRQEVGAFLHRQLKMIWAKFLPAIVRSQIWGWSGGEVTYKITPNKFIEIDSMIGRHASDCRLLLSEELMPWGVRFERIQDYGKVDLRFPYCWLHSHNAEDGENYGTSILLGAYSPWADKWFNGGALDVRRLFMHKDAYGGSDIGFPSSEECWDDVAGKFVPARDVAQQLVEQIQSGSVTARPSDRDAEGNEKWPLTRAAATANSQHIFTYPQECDVEIRWGMEIPDSVITDDGTGSWAGKRVTMAAFYANLDNWMVQIISDLTNQIFKQMVMWNFGRAEEFNIVHQTFADQAMEQQANAGPGKDAGGQGGQQPGGFVGGPSPFGQQPQQPQAMRLSLTADGCCEAIGAGVLSAAELVEAAARVIRMNVTDDAGHVHDAEGKFTSGGGAAQSTEKSVPVGFVPPRKQLGKPIVGPSGAKIVGYDWKYHYELRVRRGEEVEVPVSDWSQKGKSEGTGRDIVHHFFVEHPDGKVTLEGMNSAQKILGISLPKLKTVAKNEAAAREFRLKQEKRLAQQYEDYSAPSPNDAHRDYWQRNKMDSRPAEIQHQLLNDTVTLTKNDKYIKVPRSTGEMLKDHGWETNSPTTMAAAHAPAGGISIGGKQFTGGEFIPGEVMKKATAAEKAQLQGKPQAGKQPTAKQAEKAAKSQAAFEQLMASKSPEDAKAFRTAKADGIAIPPAWTNVVYHGKDKNILAEGRDAKGRKQRAENPDYRQRISDENNARIARDLMPKIGKLRVQLKRDAMDGDEESKVLYLITQTGFRIGGKGDGKSKSEAFGASTLMGQHVHVEGDSVTFDFPGKKGVQQKHTVNDKVIADMMRGAKPGEPVFKTRDTKVRDAWQKRYGGYKVHDIRHVVATELADQELHKLIPPPPKSDKERVKLKMTVAKTVGAKLGNNPAQSLQTYINPGIWRAIA